MKIKFPEEVFEDLKKELEWDGKEKAAFLLCHRSSSNNNVSLLVHEILVPEEPDYVVRSHSICEVRKSFINRVYKGAIETQSDVIKVHTHPPGFPAIFSPIDESHEPKFIRHIDSKIEGMEHASLVFSSAFDSVDGWHYEPDSDEFLPVEKVSIIRKDSLEILLPFRSQC